MGNAAAQFNGLLSALNGVIPRHCRQTLDAQLEQLRGAGCSRIYREKVTGAHSDRRELLRLLDHLAPGNVVTVTRIDGLARSTFDLFEIISRRPAPGILVERRFFIMSEMARIFRNRCYVF